MYKFKPYLKTVVWGGDKIAPFKGIATRQEHIGESWELSGVKGHESVIDGGPCDGMTITELAALRKDWLLGGKVYAQTGEVFPLLIKFIDAQSDLSVQVHPDDALAAVRHDGSKGKTEMWYVIGADEGAHLMSGLSEPLTPETYVSRVAGGTITGALCNYGVAPGDVFFIPAGRIHAIGAGCFVAEIQQTSDITYRIYDYGRLGLDGRPRELHVEQAREAIDYTVHPDYRSAYSPQKNVEVPLVSCEYFTTSLFDLDAPASKNLSALDSFVIVVCVAGEGVLVDNEGDGSVHKVQIRQGETLLIPASSSTIEFHPASGSPFTCLASYM